MYRLAAPMTYSELTNDHRIDGQLETHGDDPRLVPYGNFDAARCLSGDNRDWRDSDQVARVPLGGLRRLLLGGIDVCRVIPRITGDVEFYLGLSDSADIGAIIRSGRGSDIAVASLNGRWREARQLDSSGRDEFAHIHALSAGREWTEEYDH